MRLNITNCVLLLNNQIERPAVHNMFICTKLHHCEWVTIRVPLYPLFKGPPPLLTLAKDICTLTIRQNHHNPHQEIVREAQHQGWIVRDSIGEGHVEWKVNREPYFRVCRIDREIWVDTI
jgi:hypothetical protein